LSVCTIWEVVYKKPLKIKLTSLLRLSFRLNCWSTSWVTSKITMILEVLGDGKWHGIEDVRQQADLTSEEMAEIAEFLGKYGFAEVDDTNSKVKINQAFKKILTQNIT
jgi:hypothetical protein